MRLESFYLVWLEVFNEIKTLVNFLALKNSGQFLFSIILFFSFSKKKKIYSVFLVYIYTQAFFMQYMVWWDVLKVQSWCKSPILVYKPTVVVRLRKEYIYIWVCKCSRHETYGTFFFFVLFSFLWEMTIYIV